MKPAYSPEVAQELGYQKYWPEWSDWALGTGIALSVLGIFAGILYLIFH